MAEGTNCYPVHKDHADINSMCNISDTVKISFPNRDFGVFGNYENKIHVAFGSKYGWRDVYGVFRCCSNRERFNLKIAETRTELRYLFNQDFTMDTRCMIGGDETCESCGPKCDKCNGRCEDVCPKGHC